MKRESLITTEALF